MKKFSIAVLIVLSLLISVFFSANAETIKLAYKGGSLKLRNGPGTSYAVNAYLSDGDHCTVISKGSVWSKIKLDNGKTGYVKNLYISGNGSSYASGTKYLDNKITGYVKTKYASSTVNLRAGASTSTSSMGTLKNGTKVTILGTNGNWYLVSTSKGTQGYISSKYIAKSSSETAKTVKATVTGSCVYMRKSASSSSTVVTALTKGTQVTVLSSSNSNWWKVQYKDYTGYMYSKYLKK